MSNSVPRTFDCFDVKVNYENKTLHCLVGGPKQFFFKYDIEIYNESRWNSYFSKAFFNMSTQQCFILLKDYNGRLALNNYHSYLLGFLIQSDNTPFLKTNISGIWFTGAQCEQFKSQYASYLLDNIINE